MKFGVLFSGGKDSTYALYRAMEVESVACLISILPENEESYMFHTPNLWLTSLQAEAIGLPLVQVGSKGRREEELADLELALKEAKRRFSIEGVVTGAVESVYQSGRVQKVCDRLGLWCFNPLWKRNQEELVGEIIDSGFRVLISGIFAYPLDESWLGRELDNAMLEKLVRLREEHGISVSGEGGEMETTVLDAPFFKKRIEVLEVVKEYRNNAGVYRIKRAGLVGK